MSSREFNTSNKSKELFREIELNILLTELPSDLRDQFKKIFEQPEITSSYLTIAMNRLKRSLSESGNTESNLLVSSLLKIMKREFKRLAPKEHFDVLTLQISIVIALIASINAALAVDMSTTDITIARMAQILFGLSTFNFFMSKPKKVDSLELLRNSLDKFSQHSED